MGLSGCRYDLTGCSGLCPMTLAFREIPDSTSSSQIDASLARKPSANPVSRSAWSHIDESPILIIFTVPTCRSHCLHLAEFSP